MGNRTAPYPTYNYLVTATSPTGVVSTLGGFQAVSGLTSGSTTVKLQRGVVNSIVLWQWITQLRISPGNAGQTVLITLRGETGQAVMSWKLASATPASYIGPTLMGKGSGDVALQELVLTVGSIAIIAPRTAVYGNQWGRIARR